MDKTGVERLTARERDCLRLAGQGLTSGEIASRLNISTSRVDNLCQEARTKLGGVTRRAAARVLAAVEEAGQTLPGQPIPGAPPSDFVVIDPGRTQLGDPAHVREERAVFEGFEHLPLPDRGARERHHDLTSIGRLTRVAKLVILIALGLSATIQAKDFFEWVSKVVLARYQ